MRIAIILMLLLMLPGTSIAGPKEKGSKSYFIESSEFVGFEQCKISSALQETMKRLMKTEMPEKKEHSSWTFSTKGEVFGLPINSLKIGICDLSGSRDCGWGSFIAVVIPRPLEEVKKKLEKQFGGDFTREKREKNITSRCGLCWPRGKASQKVFCSATPAISSWRNARQDHSPSGR